MNSSIKESNIPEWVVRGFAPALLEAVRECLEDPQNMEEFKRWHLEYYGYEYVPQRCERKEEDVGENQDHGNL